MFGGFVGFWKPPIWLPKLEKTYSKVVEIYHTLSRWEPWQTKLFLWVWDQLGWSSTKQQWCFWFCRFATHDTEAISVVDLGSFRFFPEFLLGIQLPSYSRSTCSRWKDHFVYVRSVSPIPAMNWYRDATQSIWFHVVLINDAWTLIPYSLHHFETSMAIFQFVSHLANQGFLVVVLGRWYPRSRGDSFRVICHWLQPNLDLESFSLKHQPIFATKSNDALQLRCPLDGATEERRFGQACAGRVMRRVRVAEWLVVRTEVELGVFFSMKSCQGDI